VLTFGNNVLTEASRSAKLAWLPWEARQLILYATGTKPTFVHLADRHVGLREGSARSRALGLYGVVGYFAISLTAYPLLLVHGRIKALAGERTLCVSADHTLPSAGGMGSARTK
jgi:hypothetical protein